MAIRRLPDAPRGGLFRRNLLRDHGKTLRCPGNQTLGWALFGAALIFNPFLPIHLPRELWAVLNVGAAALFGFVAYRQRG
ncbi:DUF6804 family protein [Mesorhizobium sp. M1312]|uniref:DUF6804 family protein n=1 Tax=unclassified Mesorhizobium TaxID=325217 RepID=UPI00333CA900